MKTFIVILTMGISGALANNCYSPWAWCGWDLIKRDESYKAIVQRELRGLGYPSTEDWINNSLWRCESDDSGEVKFLSWCDDGCLYGGSPESDDLCKINWQALKV